MTRGWAGTLIAFGWTLAAACLLYRSGAYPAAMTGDEIWFSESAWHLLNEGVLRRPLHAGALSSEIADFLPPLTALAQAACFALFGVNAFAVGLQSALAPLAICALVGLLARRSGADWRWAALAGFAALGAPSILRASLYIRYEALVAICFLGSLAARPPILRGALAALAGMAYYPTAPFVGLAALVVEAGRQGPRPWGRLALGFALPSAAFAIWVAGHPSAFVEQVLQNGAGNYLTFELPRRLLEARFWRGSLDAAPEIAGLLAIAGYVASGRSPPTRRGYLLAILILAAPALLYPFSARLLSLPATLALVVAAGWAGSRPWLAGLPLALAAIVAAIALPMMALTAWLQNEGRDTRRLALALDAAMTTPGVAVIDQRAWLAVKMSQPNRPLLQAIPAGAPPQAKIFQPYDLVNSLENFRPRYLILNNADASLTIEASPALRKLVDSGACVQKQRVAPDFVELPWAKLAPYDLVLYECMSNSDS